MRHFPRSFPRTVLSVAIAAALAPAIVWAQSADARLRGKAPAGSDVTARNVATGFTRRAHAGHKTAVTRLPDCPPEPTAWMPAQAPNRW